MRKIAITGGIATGKSTVGRLLKDLGAFVVSADDIVHRLLSSDTECKQKIVELLGHSVIRNGELSRTAIAEIVFKDPDALQQLESILHPKVLQEIDKLYHSTPHTYSLFAVEIPLLYEIGCDRFFDIVLCVVCDEPIAMKRYSRSKEDFKARSRRMMPLAEKAKRADYIITNNGSLEDLKKQVEAFTAGVQ